MRRIVVQVSRFLSFAFGGVDLRRVIGTRIQFVDKSHSTIRAFLSCNDFGEAVDYIPSMSDAEDTGRDKVELLRPFSYSAAQQGDGCLPRTVECGIVAVRLRNTIVPLLQQHEFPLDVGIKEVPPNRPGHGCVASGKVNEK